MVSVPSIVHRPPPSRAQTVEIYHVNDLLTQAEEVTVFSHFLHMHENGRRLQTRQYRNDSSGNEALVHSADVEYYSFLQAGGYLVTTNDSVTIQVCENEAFKDRDAASSLR